MSKVLVTESSLYDIADAIRSKNESADTYRPGDMAAAILAIPTGSDPTLVSKTITQNGAYDPEDDNADGYSDVTVNVPNSYSAADEGKVVQSGALVAQTGLTVTENGTYDTTTNDEVVVNVQAAGQAVVPNIALSPYGASQFRLVNGRDITGFQHAYGFFAPINNAGWMDFDWSESWEIGVAFKVDSVTGNFAVIGEGNNTSRYADIPGLEIVGSGIGRGISTQGGTVWTDWANIKTDLSAGTWYFAVMSFDKTTMQLTTRITADFENWESNTYTMTAPPYHNAQYKICFGGLMRDSYHTKADAHIDVYNTYIKINGTMAWGTYTGAFPQN